MRQVLPQAVVCTGVLLLALTACAAPPPPLGPLPGPPVVSPVVYTSGSLLAASTAGTEAPAPGGESFLARVDFFAVEHLAGTSLDSAAERTRLITATKNGAPVLPAPNLTAGAAAAPLPDSPPPGEVPDWTGHGRSTRISRAAGALAADHPVVFACQGAVAEIAPPFWEPFRKLVEIHIRRFGAPPGQVEFLLAVEDLAAPPEADIHAGENEGWERAPVLQREEIVLEPWPLAGRSAFAFLLPSPFSDSPARGIGAIVVLIAPAAANPTERLLLERALGARDSALGAAAAEGETPPAPEPVLTGRWQPDPTAMAAAWPGIQEALARLAIPEAARGTFIYLAAMTGASLTGDVALAAPEGYLAALAEDVLEAVQAAPPDDPATAGWIIERATFRTLAQSQAAGTQPPELLGLLTRHAGALSLHPVLIREALENSDRIDDLAEQLVARNILLLSDASPAARTSAYDWLARQGRAPAGFDPLAPLAERRAALERAWERRYEEMTE